MKIIFQISISDNIFFTEGEKIGNIFSWKILCKNVFIITILLKHNGEVVIFKTFFSVLSLKQALVRISSKR